MIASREYHIGYVIIKPGDPIPEDILNHKDFKHIKEQNERGDKANKRRAEADKLKADKLKADKAKSDSTDKVKVN
ncbi:hypothetical protein LCGC14_2189930 [marine sediment metagenome]|uniref:Uncharacterized protein n=1 Tax=marine sediment metagenome TaxID=412755 RepID=A0A0F9DJT4_9ZZZZ